MVVAASYDHSLQVCSVPSGRVGDGVHLKSGVGRRELKVGKYVGKIKKLPTISTYFYLSC